MPKYNSNSNDYNVLAAYLAEDKEARRHFVGLSVEEQQRLISGAQNLQTHNEVGSYIWDYIDSEHH